MTDVGFISPNSQNSGRGIGFYVENLLPHLVDQAREVGINVQQLGSVSANQFKLVHYPFFDLFTPSLKLYPHTKTVVTVHDVIPLQYPHIYRPGLKGKINFLRQKYYLSKTDHIITDSKASLDQLRQLLIPENITASVIHLAPADHFFKTQTSAFQKEVLARFDLPEKFVLYVGDINYNKNLPTLFKACRMANLHLVIAGKSAKNILNLDTSHHETAHIAVLADQLRSSPNDFSLLGFVTDDELSALYRRCTVYCQPSFYEGFGLTPLEAMACGAVVVCSLTPALQEVTGGNCIYFDPNSPEQLAEMLKFAYLKSEKIFEMIKKAENHARSFSWVQTARQTLSVYRNLLNI